MVVNYLVQQVDGTSRFKLQDGSGFLILQSSAGLVQKPEIVLEIPSTQDKTIQLNDNKDILILG